MPNPGGTLKPEEVIGRDALIQTCWNRLTNQSIALIGPRRMGKTSLCGRMAHWPPKDTLIRRRNLERCSTAAEFTRLLFEDVSTLLSPSHKVMHRVRSLIEAWTGSIQLKGVQLQLQHLDWQQLLDAIFSDLESYCTANNLRVVLIWDEFSLCLHQMDLNGNSREAMLLLNLLRANRQSHPHIRMVLAGSIGLHEVIASLKRQGYSNSPINDVAKIIVPPLAPAAAAQLVTALGKGLQAGLSTQTAAEIASICEGHPYLIQHVLLGLHEAGLYSTEAAEGALNRLFDAPGDPLDLMHYLSRLKESYRPEVAALAVELLDQIAATEQGSTATELIEQFQQCDPELVREVLHALRRDLYLRREGWRFHFAYGFLRRYWQRERGL